MIIAIPIFGSRVSPRFDSAQELLLVEETGGGAVTKKRIPIEHWSPPERAGRLAALGVEVVICGGINGFLAQQLAYRGIQVYSWVTGEAEDALWCFLNGQIESGAMTGPGGPRGRWRLGGGGRRRRGRWPSPGRDPAEIPGPIPPGGRGGRGRGSSS